jgi:hypothetical protein
MKLGITALLIVGLGAACSPVTVAAPGGHRSPRRKHSHHRHHHPKRVLLTGLGAKEQVWNTHHVADSIFPGNYDPMPEGTYPDALDNDQFALVTFDGLHRVDTFSQKFTPGTTQASAIAAVVALLPPGARKIAGPIEPAGGSSCLAEEFKSKILAAQDGGRKGITVTYQSSYGLSLSPYTSQDVREAFVLSTHGIVPAGQFGKGTFGNLICG